MIKITHIAFRYLELQILLNRKNWLLWTPCFFATGILLYIGLKEEPNFFIAPCLALLSALLFISRKKFYTYTLLIITLGFLYINIRSIMLKAPIITTELKLVKIIGRISSITPTNKGNRLIIDKLFLQDLEENETPVKIRVLFKTKINEAQVGDIVSFIANLSPPPIPVIPGGYNFAFQSYFEQIGGVGYSLSSPKVIDEDKTILTKIETLRNNIERDVIEVLGRKIGNIAAALMIGQYSAIDENILQDMRAVGISHILSVSGMHLSLVAALFFFFTRLIVALLYPITFRVNAKKIGAWAAIIGSFFYLLISGMQIAAVRSFIMSLMIIVAVLIDRTASPIRSISFAAIVILVTMPESIVHPSFQMSFAAVLALISCYDLYRKYLKNIFKELTLYKRIIFYFISTIMSSIVAGLATAPFVIYHFNQYSNYSIIANLIAVPITSFLIMPAILIAFLLYPIGLIKYPLLLVGIGIELIIITSEKIAKLPYALHHISHISNISLISISLGFLLFCLLNHSIRIIGLIIILFGSILAYLTPLPKAFIEVKNNSFIIVASDELISPKKISKYTRENFMKYMGRNKITYRYIDRSIEPKADEYKKGNILIYETSRINVRDKIGNRYWNKIELYD